MVGGGERVQNTHEKILNIFKISSSQATLFCQFMLPFLVSFSYLYPLKTSENPRLSNTKICFCIVLTFEKVVFVFRWWPNSSFLSIIDVLKDFLLDVFSLKVSFWTEIYLKVLAQCIKLTYCRVKMFHWFLTSGILKGWKM